MKPKINKTNFGSITIEGKTFDHDVIIRLNGDVKKRKRKLSKAVHGTSHIVSLDEAKYVYEKGAERIIIGSGQSGLLKLSNEASEFFRKRKCMIDKLPTSKAIQSWNEAEESMVGLFHVTC